MAGSASPDSFQSQEDPSLGEESAGGKTSFFGKLKEKTVGQGRKLKTKLKPSSKTPTDDSPGNYFDDESPASNSVESGATQTEDEQETPTEQQPSYGSEESTAEPTQNFPGDFAGVADDKTVAEAKADDSELSKDFEGLSTNEKSGEEDTEATPAPESDIGDSYKSSEETTGSNTTPDESEYSEQTTEPQASPAPESAIGDDSEPSEQTTESTEDKVVSAKDETKEKLFGGDAGSEQKYTSPDVPAASEEPEQSGEESAAEPGKSWTGWAAEKVGVAKETAASEAPTTDDETPVHEKAYDDAVEAKDSDAAQTYPSSIPSDPSQQTYVQRAAQTVGNLQTSLGFGQNSAASSPTTTPVATNESSAQSPGIVSRITGLFTASKPATDNSTPSPKETSTETE